MKKPARITYITERLLMVVVLIVSIVGLIINDDHSVKSDYVFNIGQCLKFLAVSCLPFFLKKFKLDIPDAVYIIFSVFCLAHFLCGEILGFFVKIKWWDSLLHTFSGMLIALLSFSLVDLLNKLNTDEFKLNIWFTTFVAFTMTVTAAVMWEIYEFASDMLFGTNMQRAYISTESGRGAALSGMAAVSDTMKDIILDTVGGLITCVVCALFVAKNKIKMEDLSFIKRQRSASDKPIKSVTNSEVLEEFVKDNDGELVLEKVEAVEEPELNIETEPIQVEIIQAEPTKNNQDTN